MKKQDLFTIVLQCCFLFNERQSHNKASLHNKILSTPLFMVTSRGKREPTRDTVHNVCVKIFLSFFFFFTIPNSQNMFLPHELQQICINSTCK